METELLGQHTLTSQQVMYHGPGDEDITGHFKRKSTCGVGYVTLGIFEVLDLEPGDVVVERMASWSITPLTPCSYMLCQFLQIIYLSMKDTDSSEE
jgi:hypothetical protein